MSWVDLSCELVIQCQQSERRNRVYIQRRNIGGSIVFIAQSCMVVEHVPNKIRVVARLNWYWGSNRNMLRVGSR